MLVDAFGWRVDTEALEGYTKTKFCKSFKQQNRVLSKKGKSVEDVWELIKNDIPKTKKKK